MTPLKSAAADVPDISALDCAVFKDGQCPNVDQIPALKSIDTETLNANAAALQTAVSELEDITAWRVVSMLEFGIDRRTEKNT